MQQPPTTEPLVATLLPTAAVDKPTRATLRNICYEITEGKKKWWVARTFQASIMSLIVVNVALVIVDTEPVFNTAEGTPFNAFYTKFEIVSVIIFASEYVVRLWCCVESPNHRSRYTLDALAMLPPPVVLDPTREVAIRAP